MSRDSQKIVLTGATGGIGEAIAMALDREGYTLLLTGRDADKLESLSNRLTGTSHQTVVADLTTDAGIAALQSSAKNMGIHGVINCLGINDLGSVVDIESERMSRLLSTNLWAPMAVCKALIPQLIESGSRGVIVNIGSILGSIGYAGSTVYCATKFGLRGFTEALRRELSDTDIAVIYLAPRATNTALNTDAMDDMNRELGNAVDEPEVVAEQVVNVIARGKSVNRYVGWPESLFVRINSLFPRVVDKAVAKQLAIIKRYFNVKTNEESMSEKRI